MHILKLQDFFQGTVIGDGVIYGITRNIVKTFHVKMNCKWNENYGEFDESFIFSDGQESKRLWRIRIINESEFEGYADDVVGIAKGMQNSNYANLKYKLKIPYGKGSLVLTMDDWMHLIADNVIINRTSMKKFGIKVGELVIFLRRS